MGEKYLSRPRSTDSRPLIGITAGRKVLETSVGPMSHFVQPVFYVDAVIAAGGVPVILPSAEGLTPKDTSQKRQSLKTEGGLFLDLLSTVDGLIITGGEDIDPAQYGQDCHPTVQKVDKLRDQFEIDVARFALSQDWPLLGVCRGAQVVNVAAGGTLVQDLPSQQPSPVAHWQTEMTKPAHEVEINSESRLYAAIGAGRIHVNSAHHQAVQAIAPQLHPVAWAEDGVIEATESPTHRWVIAVQWHPEMLYENDSSHLRLFQALVEAARNNRRLCLQSA